MSSISYLKLMALIEQLKGGFTMKPEDLFVPADKCPLDFLAEMGERIKNSWIFVDQTVVNKLKESEGVTDKRHGLMGHCLTWEATEDYPETKVVYDVFYGTGWYVILEIEADDIAYKTIGSVKEADAVIRLKMAA